MKKLGLLAIAFFLVLSFGSVTFGQTADLEVGADVLTGLSFGTVTDVSFGYVQGGTDATIDPTSSPTHTNAGLAGSSVSVGNFTISGTDGADVNFSWSPSNATLAHATLSDLSFTPTVVNVDDNTISSGSTIQLGFSTNAAGDFEVNVGRTINTSSLSAGQTGNWSTTNTGGTPITFTISYN
ncbi:MAG: hypothetical protein K9N46_11670 [Candidatus Marinimicrobia bacterium]|nr:hypothetical protein [Candidatus Neomarinimicrobiota bacterium]MCF7827380.1 hypothetical protein [Candidatus Neomarinimicrobiota bacterium]MCF7881387.1 hypothetical protein [Candidatus Neomarinimicrobiota bacterium]